MRLGGIPVTHTDGFPQVAPSADAALIGRIYIAAGDHVSVRRAAELPAFNGIVTNVVQSLDDIDDEAFHPVIDGLRPHPFRRYLRIQVFLINDDSLIESVEHWTNVPDDVRTACGPMPEAAATDCVVWVPSNIIDQDTFLLHYTQCINCEYGNVYGRGATHFVRYIALLQSDEDENVNAFNLHEMEREEYPILSEFGPLVTTERRLCALHLMWRTNQQLLVKTGQFGGWIFLKYYMDRDIWAYIFNRIQSLGGHNVTISNINVECKEGKLHPNLSLETVLTESTRVTVKTNNIAGVEAVKEIISQLAGIGVKKKLCGKRDINDINANPQPLEDDTIVTMVDVNLNEYEDTEGWLDGEMVRRGTQYNNPNTNYFKFMYDSRLNEFRMGLSGAALVAGSCRAARFVDAMANARPDRFAHIIDVPDPDVRIWLGMNLKIHTDDDIQLWEVHRYNHVNGETTIIRCSQADERRTVDVNFVLTHQS